MPIAGSAERRAKRMNWTEDDSFAIVEGGVTAAAGWQDSVPAPDSRTDELEAAFTKLWFGQLNLVVGRLRERARSQGLVAHLPGGHNQKAHGSGNTGIGVWKDGKLVSGKKAGDGAGAGGGTSAPKEPVPTVAGNANAVLEAAMARQEGTTDVDAEKVVFDYTGAGGPGSFRSMNGALRSPDSIPEDEREAVGKAISDMDDAFDTFGVKNGRDILVFRAVGGENATRMKNMRPGEEFVEDGYLATTTSADFAEYFGGYGEGDTVTMAIMVPRGMVSMTADQRQEELVFPRGLTLTALGPNANGRPRMALS